MISAPRERMIYLRCDIALSRDEIRLRRMNGVYITTSGHRSHGRDSANWWKNSLD
ncbi:MAG: hypothetical protein IIZ19_02380 [Clostridia bacterium]|nr:hypothetical protein [Clostridia bacterium]